MKQPDVAGAIEELRGHLDAIFDPVASSLPQVESKMDEALTSP